MAFILPDDSKVHLKAAFLTAAGNPATVDTSAGMPAWTSANPAVVEIQNVSADGMECDAVAMGPLDSAQISISADADLGAGVRPVVGVLDIEVHAAEAVSASISAGTPEPK